MPVIMGFDGSRSGDATAISVVSLEPVPHIDVVGLWERPRDAHDWEVPRTEVKDIIRDACKRWDVKGIAWDEFCGWTPPTSLRRGSADHPVSAGSAADVPGDAAVLRDGRRPGADPFRGRRPGPARRQRRAEGRLARLADLQGAQVEPPEDRPRGRDGDGVWLAANLEDEPETEPWAVWIDA
jgi:hypothetical protein